MSLATQVLKLGSTCAVTGTLFDLRRAAAERAATVRGGCSEDAIVLSLEAMVKKLGARTTADATAEKPSWSTDRAAKERMEHRVAVNFRSSPPGADVYLNGRKVGVTNSEIRVAPGTYDFVLKPPLHYETHRAQITISGPRRIDVVLKRLAISRRELLERTEFLGISGEIGPVISGGNVATLVGLRLDLVTIKWPSLYWSVLEFHGLWGAAWFGVSHLGYILSLGESGQHQIRLGGGVGGVYAIVAPDGGDTVHGVGLALVPSAEYHYISKSFFVLGAGLRVATFIGDYSSMVPIAILGSLSFGFQS